MLKPIFFIKYDFFKALKHFKTVAWWIAWLLSINTSKNQRICSAIGIIKFKLKFNNYYWFAFEYYEIIWDIKFAVKHCSCFASIKYYLVSNKCIVFYL